jgi:hypothetical protein
VAWRVGRKLGRTLYLDELCIGMLDDPELARAVADGLALLEELGEGDLWQVRLVVWRLRLRALRLAALKQRPPPAAPRARSRRRGPPLARR